MAADAVIERAPRPPRDGGRAEWPACPYGRQRNAQGMASVCPVGAAASAGAPPGLLCAFPASCRAALRPLRRARGPARRRLHSAAPAPAQGLRKSFGPLRVVRAPRCVLSPLGALDGGFFSRAPRWSRPPRPPAARGSAGFARRPAAAASAPGGYAPRLRSVRPGGRGARSCLALLSAGLGGRGPFGRVAPGPGVGPPPCGGFWDGGGTRSAARVPRVARAAAGRP